MFYCDCYNHQLTCSRFRNRTKDSTKRIISGPQRTIDHSETTNRAYLTNITANFELKRRSRRRIRIKNWWERKRTHSEHKTKDGANDGEKARVIDGKILRRDERWFVRLRRRWEPRIVRRWGVMWRHSLSLSKAPSSSPIGGGGLSEVFFPENFCF